MWKSSATSTRTPHSLTNKPIKLKNMAKTKIYGASDDLIEIDGEVSEEYNKINAKNLSINASDGTQAKITYNDEGEWKIDLINMGNKYLDLILSVGDDDKHTHEDAIDCSSYSDVLVLDDGIEWVKVGGKKFKK